MSKKFFLYNEQELLSRMSQGDDNAFRKVYELFFRSLCYFAYGIIHNMPQAEDIASVALTKVWENRQSFDQWYSLRSFLYTTTRNASLNYLKSVKVREAAGANLVVADTIDIQEDELLALEMETQLLQHVYNAIEELPTTAKKIFVLLYIERLSTNEIAQRLSMPVQTVRNNKTRALELLRIALLRKNISPFLLFYYFLQLK